MEKQEKGQLAGPPGREREKKKDDLILKPVWKRRIIDMENSNIYDSGKRMRAKILGTMFTIEVMGMLKA